MSLGAASKNKQTVQFTNLDKIYYPKARVTKGDVIGYYQTIAKYILPHLKNRPLTLKRYPEGITKPPIYQRHIVKSKIPTTKFQIKTIPIYVADKKTVKDFIICNNTNSLLYLAQLGAIELHPWYSATNNGRESKFTTATGLLKSSLNYPTFMVFDLDAPRKVFSKEVIEAALTTKKVLGSFKLRSFVKTSGKSGLHIYVPLKRQYTFERVRDFAREVGVKVQNVGANITLEQRKVKRGKAVFFDYNQNALSKSLISVYSLRATDNATVSFPVSWKTLSKLTPTDYTIKTAPRLLQKHGDIWAELLKPTANDILP